MIDEYQIFVGRRYIEGIGRRKRASARVRIYPDGNGQFLVNGKEVKEYFPREGDHAMLMGPLTDVEMEAGMDVTVLISGGGTSGQVGAVRLGVARALLKLDETLRGGLRAKGHLTRDPRIKERKKPGLKRARKAPTYTKR